MHNSRGASVDITNGKVYALKTQFVDFSYTIGALLEKQSHVGNLVESVIIPNPSVDPFFARTCRSMVRYKSTAELPRICGLFGLHNLREIVVIPGHDLAAFRKSVFSRAILSISARLLKNENLRYCLTLRETISSLRILLYTASDTDENPRHLGRTQLSEIRGFQRSG